MAFFVLLAYEPLYLKGNFGSLMPALLALLLALISKRIILSLVLALVLGAFYKLRSGSLSFLESLSALPWETALYLIKPLADKDNVLILVFIALILATTAMISFGGGFRGLTDWLEKKAKGRVRTQLFTAIAGLIIFIDDYINALVVGSQMRPVADRFRISREKLAFIVDSTSAPVAGIALVSTWVGYEAGLMQKMSSQLGLGLNGYGMVIDILPYRFYCIFMILFVFLLILTNYDWGKMAQAEKRALETGDVSAADARLLGVKDYAFLSNKLTEQKGYISIFLIPMSLLLLFILTGLILDGGGMTTLSENGFRLFTGSFWRSVLSNAKHNKEIMAGAGLFAFSLAAMLSFFLSNTTIKDIAKAFAAGARGALLPAAILLLAWGLKSAMQDLASAEFIIKLFANAIPLIFVPVFIFLLSAFVSFLTGTSYGTMAILLPLAMPLAYSMEGNYDVVTMLTMAAVLDGAIFGDHTSPLSDTTIMSSIACSCDPIHHVRTQLPYALLVAFFALLLGYLGVAMAWPTALPYLLFPAVYLLMFFIRKRIN